MTELWKKIEDEEKHRAALMPSEEDAVKAMAQAYTRLTELGWRPAIYCPKDGTVFQAIGLGCGVAKRCHYGGEWPDGTWWVEDAGDFWPGRPCLWKPIEENVDAQS